MVSPQGRFRRFETPTGSGVWRSLRALAKKRAQHHFFKVLAAQGDRLETRILDKKVWKIPELCTMLPDRRRAEKSNHRGNVENGRDANSGICLATKH